MKNVVTFVIAAFVVWVLYWLAIGFLILMVAPIALFGVGIYLLSASSEKENWMIPSGVLSAVFGCVLGFWVYGSMGAFEPNEMLYLTTPGYSPSPGVFHHYKILAEGDVNIRRDMGGNVTVTSADPTKEVKFRLRVVFGP